MIHPNVKLMERAISLAREKYKEGGHAVAAIVVKEDDIIAEAFTTLKRDNDPTCHAEINAIRIATQKLGKRFLENCFLYTTYEPCPMCSSAAVWARMKGIIYGASMEDATKECPQRIKIRCAEVLKNGTPRLELYPDCLREKCKKLLTLDAQK